MNGKGLIIAVVSVGVALGMLIVTLHQTTSAAIRDVRSDVANLREEVHRDISDLRDRMGGLEQRMARLEGLFDGYTKREAAN